MEIKQLMELNRKLWQQAASVILLLAGQLEERMMTAPSANTEKSGYKTFWTECAWSGTKEGEHDVTAQARSSNHSIEDGMPLPLPRVKDI